jgi:hypothetical protein
MNHTSITHQESQSHHHSSLISITLSPENGREYRLSLLGDRFSPKSADSGYSKRVGMIRGA